MLCCDNYILNGAINRFELHLFFMSDSLIKNVSMETKSLEIIMWYNEFCTEVFNICDSIRNMRAIYFTMAF